MERLGLVGLPNSGKSSLFNALTGGDTPVAAHPFSTAETAVGIGRVPDDRLERLGVMSESKKVVPATMELTDIAALVKGANAGEGLGNRFLGALREVDALCLVLRAFEDDNVVGGTDPVEDLATLELELVLADLASVEGAIGRRRKAAGLDKSLTSEVAALERALSVLGEGVPIYRAGFSDDELAHLTASFLLTTKPLLVVVNLGEDQVGESETEAVLALVRAALGPDGPEPLGACIQLEAEASRLAPADKAELLEGLGLGEGVVPRVARTAYHLLGRRMFFTTGDKESRAWTFRAGARAPECAGVIHSDLQRGFIRAEVIHWDELLEIGSWTKAKDAGRLRIEGKEYEVTDGDVLEIRFNV